MDRKKLVKSAVVVLGVVIALVVLRLTVKKTQLGDHCLGSADCHLKNGVCLFQASGDKYVEGTGQCTMTCESDADCGASWTCESLSTKSLYQASDAQAGSRLCVAKPR